MKVILIGERYSSNLGDGVIYDTVKRLCEDIYTDIEFISIDISGSTHYSQNKNMQVAKLKLLFPKMRRKLSKIKRKILLNQRLKSIDLKNVNGAIFVGGQLFTEYFSSQILTIAKFLNKNNIPTIYNSCGLGKNISEKSVKMLTTAFKFSNVKAISLRDNFDEFQRLYGHDIPVAKSLDPVNELGKYIKKEDVDVKVGIGLIEPKHFLHNKISFTNEDYHRLVSIIIDELNKKKIEWEFFTNGNEDDYNFINEVCEKEGIQKKISKRPFTPQELIETINSYSSIISFRLHSHIIATSLGMDVIGFNWDNKVREFSEIIGEDENFLDLNDRVFDKISEIVRSHDFIYKGKEYSYKGIMTAKEFLSLNKFEEE